MLSVDRFAVILSIEWCSGVFSPYTALQPHIPLSPETARWVLMSRILRARGNKGEVAAEILTDFPERLTELREVFVREPDPESPPRRVHVKSCWPSQNHQWQAASHFNHFH